MAGLETSSGLSKQDRKVFLGGLSWSTTGNKLKEHFEIFGPVEEAFVSCDKKTGRPRGFGFVIFKDASTSDKVLEVKHTIDSKEVEAKRAVAKQDRSPTLPNDTLSITPVAKVFVGGLPPTVDQEQFRQYFEQFGAVKDAVVMYEHDTRRHRGFGFVTYQSYEDAERVCSPGQIHKLGDKPIDVKPAVPKDQMVTNRRPPAFISLSQTNNSPIVGGQNTTNWIGSTDQTNSFNPLLSSTYPSYPPLGAANAQVGAARPQLSLPVYPLPPQNPSSQFASTQMSSVRPASFSPGLPHLPNLTPQIQSDIALARTSIGGNNGVAMNKLAGGQIGLPQQNMNQYRLNSMINGGGLVSGQGAQNPLHQPYPAQMQQGAVLPGVSGNIVPGRVGYAGGPFNVSGTSALSNSIGPAGLPMQFQGQGGTSSALGNPGTVFAGGLSGASGLMGINQQQIMPSTSQYLQDSGRRDVFDSLHALQEALPDITPAPGAGHLDSSLVQGQGLYKMGGQTGGVTSGIN